MKNKLLISFLLIAQSGGIMGGEPIVALTLADLMHSYDHQYDLFKEWSSANKALENKPNNTEFIEANEVASDKYDAANLVHDDNMLRASKEVRFNFNKQLLKRSYTP